MSVPFPNEQPISTHDTIDLTENGVFSTFEEALQETPAGANQSKRDYEFRQAGTNGHIILAKPVRSGNLWAIDITSGAGTDWIEKAQYDPTTGSIDDSQSPSANVGVPVPAGTCPACGANGVSGKFCNSCGGSLAQASVSMSGNLTPLGTLPGGTQVIGVGPGGGQISVGLPAGPAVPVAGQLQPGQSPSAGAGAIAAPAHVNPDRMTGRPKKEVIVPEGMRVTKSTGFADELEKLLADAEKDQT
jgi:hypothetical protein